MRGVCGVGCDNTKAGVLDGPLHNSLLWHFLRYGYIQNEVLNKEAQYARGIREDKEESGKRTSRLVVGEEERSGGKDMEQES